MSEQQDAAQRDLPRVTPYDLVFGAAVFDEAQFAEVLEQAEAHGAATAAELFMLPAAGELLRSLVPPGGGPDAVAQVRALLFSAFRYWQHGRHTWRIPDALLRTLLQRTAAAAPALPLPAGYVQLPRHVMWARIDEEGAPEPVDGFFWSVPSIEAAGPLELLFALGIRPGRPGLSLFDVRIEQTAQLEQWAGVNARESGADFANVLPGGELQNYHALTTRAEALKLAALCLDAIAHGTNWRAHDDDGRITHSPVDG
jgi:hypothetical protein